MLKHRHFAGFGVHFHFGHRAGVRFGRVGVHLAGLGVDIALGLHEDAAPGDRFAILEVRRQGQVDDVDAPVWASL